MWTKFRLRAVWVMVPLYLLFAQPTARLLLIGLLFVIPGVLIRGWAATAIRKNRVLTVHGPYAFTRNPLYLGSFLIGIGFGVASGQLWMLALFLIFFLIVYGLTMRREERGLAARFGEDFDRYFNAVPRFLPRPTAWSPSRGSPSTPGTATLADPQPDTAAASPATASASSSDAQRDASASRPLLKRYWSSREWEALLGVTVMYLALVLKLVL